MYRPLLQVIILVDAKKIYILKLDLLMGKMKKSFFLKNVILRNAYFIILQKFFTNQETKKPRNNEKQIILST